MGSGEIVLWSCCLLGIVAEYCIYVVSPAVEDPDYRIQICAFGENRDGILAAEEI